MRELEISNGIAAESHVKRIVGPTILMGDGSYFDFEAPDASAMTIEDYAWGLASANRFRGQTRVRDDRHPTGVGARCLYSVAQHVVLMAEQMLRDGHPLQAAYEGLMHESDEVPWGDFPGPGKALMSADFRALVKRDGEAIDRRFNVGIQFADLVKQYDLRMLATEKRDLMPQSGSDQWKMLGGYGPFDFKIECWPAQHAAGIFLNVYHSLREMLF